MAERLTGETEGLHTPVHDECTGEGRTGPLGQTPKRQIWAGTVTLFNEHAWSLTPIPVRVEAASFAAAVRKAVSTAIQLRREHCRRIGKRVRVTAIRMTLARG